VLQRINKCSRMHQTCMSSRTDVDMSSFSEVTYWLGPPPYGLLKLPKLLIVRALEAARDAERDLVRVGVGVGVGVGAGVRVTVWVRVGVTSG
jgi:hypothetical protein